MISSTKAQFQYETIKHDAESPRVFGIGIHVATRTIAASFACIYFVVFIAHAFTFDFARFVRHFGAEGSDWAALLQNVLLFAFLLFSSISATALFFANITSEDRTTRSANAEKSFESVLETYDVFRYMSVPMLLTEFLAGVVTLGNCLVCLLRLTNWPFKDEEMPMKNAESAFLNTSSLLPTAASPFPFRRLLFGLGLLVLSYVHASCIRIVQKDREYLVQKHRRPLLPTRHSFHPPTLPTRRPLIRPTRLPL